jgi:hypothetical protein
MTTRLAGGPLRNAVAKSQDWQGLSAFCTIAIHQIGASNVAFRTLAYDFG